MVHSDQKRFIPPDAVQNPLGDLLAAPVPGQIFLGPHLKRSTITEGLKTRNPDNGVTGVAAPE